MGLLSSPSTDQDQMLQAWWGVDSAEIWLGPGAWGSRITEGALAVSWPKLPSYRCGNRTREKSFAGNTWQVRGRSRPWHPFSWLPGWCSSSFTSAKMEKENVQERLRLKDPLLPSPHLDHLGPPDAESAVLKSSLFLPLSLVFGHKRT